MMVRQYLAPGGFVVSLQNCMNEEAIAGYRRLGPDARRHRLLHHRGTLRARPCPPRRRQGRRRAHRLPGRRSAWPHHRPRREVGRLLALSDSAGDQQPLGRALVEAGHQRHGQRHVRLHRPDQPRRSCWTTACATSPRGWAARRSASARRWATSSRRSTTSTPRSSRAPARAMPAAQRDYDDHRLGKQQARRRCAPALDGPGHDEGTADRDRVPQRLHRRRGPRRSASPRRPMRR